MALPVNVEGLIHGNVVESNRIEFKAGLNETPVLHSICAFANDIDNIGGGYIVIGVEEKDGVPVLPPRGINRADVDRILKKLLELCHYLEPFYEPIAEPVLYHGVYLIVIWCAGGYGRPYKAPKDALSKQSNKYYYIRKFSSSVIASSEEEKELFYLSSSIPFDDRPNLASSVSDLDLGLIRDYLGKVDSSLTGHMESESLEELADDLRLLDGPPESRKPRNIGLLMFSRNVAEFFPEARIEVVDIPDPTGTNMTEKIFQGPIQYQLINALEYIRNYILKEKVFKRSDRAEAERVWNYPYAAVEEILSNAVYHRSYQIWEPITVRCTPEAMEITSFPGFDRSITDEDIANGRIRGKIYRNRRIGDFLKELKLIEGRNTGFPTAYRALRQNGSPELQFSMDADRHYLSVAIPVHPSFFSASEKKQKAYEDKILAAIPANESRSMTELALSMGYRGITRKLRETVDRMTADGSLLRVAEGSQVKYRTGR